MPSFITRGTRTLAGAVLTILLASCGGSDDGAEAQAPADPPAVPGATGGITLANFQAAAVAIGQPDLQSRDVNQGLIGPGAGTLNQPAAVAVAPDGRMFVVDRNNFRILGFDSVPTAHGAAATLVLGQQDFETAVQPANADASTLIGAIDISFGGGKTAIVDNGGNRVLIYNGIPSAGDGAAVVVGQQNFGATGAACSASGMSSPSGAILTPDGKLIVVDAQNHRVLIWTQVPTMDGVEANIVLGQPNGDTCIQNNDAQAGGPSNRTLNSPTGIWSDGSRLAVVDSVNNRVLIWTTFPTAFHQPANLVLGQVNFANIAANDSNDDGAEDPDPTASTMRVPQGPKSVGFNGFQFAVADTSNHRVLVWNGFPVANGQAADIVLGQQNAQTDASNDTDGNGITDGVNARTMSIPVGVTFWGSKLLVPDLNNHRVLVFESQ